MLRCDCEFFGGATLYEQHFVCSFSLLQCLRDYRVGDLGLKYGAIS